MAIPLYLTSLETFEHKSYTEKPFQVFSWLILKNGCIVGPGVHLVGTLNILTFHAQGRVASAKCHMYMCTYMKGNYNPYRSCWEIFSLACTIGHLLYFVKKFKNLTADIFFTDFPNLKN